MTNNSPRGQTYDRRTILKATGSAGAAAVGLSGLSQPGAAGDKDDEIPTAAGKKSGDCDPDETPSAVYTGDHIDTTWYGSVHITSGNSTTNYDTIGDPLPDSPDEMVVHCHGWRNDDDCGKERINTTAEAFAVENYEYPVTGLVWDSSYAWWNAKEIADKNGVKLANFLVDYKDDNPETTLRLQGHSLGARVVAETIRELDRMGAYDVLTTAVFLGGAIENHSVAVDGRYGPAIENVVQHAENFWMEDDTVLDWAFTTYEFSRAIGNDGCDGTPPVNYTDHHIQLDDHRDHYQPNIGTVGDAIETFEEEQEGDNRPDDDESNVPDDGGGGSGGDGPGFTIPAVAAGVGGATLLHRLRNRGE